MDQASFQNTLTFFYQNPSPEAAADAIRWWVTSPHSMQVGFDENPCNIMLYAFVRLGQLHPDLLRVYEQLFDEANPWGQRFLARVLAHVGDDISETWAEEKSKTDRNPDLRAIGSGKRRDPITTVPIVSPVQLDLLWTEFGLTGDESAVKEIVWCFIEPSEVKRRLNEWLSKKGLLTWLLSGRRADQLSELQQGLGIVCRDGEVQNREDVDVLCLQDQHFGNITFHSYSEAARFLPIRVPFRARIRMMVKMLAKWSFFSNALQHDRVRQLCLDCLDQPPPDPHATTAVVHPYFAFLDIGINLCLARWDYAAALRLTEKFVQGDPHSRRAQELFDSLTARQRLEELISLPETADDVIPIQGIVASDLLKQCAEHTRRAKSYFSQCHLHNVALGDESEASWRFAYEEPGNFEVHQETRVKADPTGPKYDLWYTINGITLNHLHLMSRSPMAGSTDEPPVNQQLLAVDNFLASLPETTIDEIMKTCDSKLLVLQGTLPKPPKYLQDFFHPAGAGPCRLFLWIFNESQKGPLLAKYLLQFGTVKIEQAFSGYDKAHVDLGVHA